MRGVRSALFARGAGGAGRPGRWRGATRFAYSQVKTKRGAATAARAAAVWRTGILSLLYFIVFLAFCPDERPGRLSLV